MKVSLTCCMVILFARMTLSCGINWGEPRSKIEGCNEQGYVLIAEKLAELNIPDEKEPVPIWATFDSSRQTASPYIGMGWKIPFLESSMVQLSETEFQFVAPGGWKQLFRRSGKDTDILVGGGGWKGRLSLDHATLWADCGWRIDLHKGKIVQMKTPHGQTLSYNYTNGRVASVTCGMKTLISLDLAEGPDNTIGITIDGKPYSLVKTDQPRVQRVAGVNVIGGNDPSFNQLTGPEIQTRTFAYSVDDQTRPLLTITNAADQNTTVSWDPETHQITRYGEWKYDVKPGVSMLANASIARANAAGQKEFWFKNIDNGTEIVQGIDGVRRTTNRYTSSLLVGKIREISETKDGEVRTVIKNSYDENGRILRSIDKWGVIQIPRYDKSGNVIGRTYELDNSPELAARRDVEEQKHLKAIKTATDKYEKDYRLRSLAAFYIYALHAPSKAMEIAKEISSEGERSSILLIAIQTNAALGNAEKIAQYQKVLAAHPSEHESVIAAVDKLKKEMNH